MASCQARYSNVHANPAGKYHEKATKVCLFDESDAKNMTTEKPTQTSSPNPTAPINPHAVEETKQQIRLLVGEIQQLTRKEVEPDIFYGEFLKRVVQALAAVGGAVWLLKDGRELRLSHQISVQQAFPQHDPDEQQLHNRLLQRVLTEGEQLLVPPYSGTEGDEQAGNPTAYLLVLAPIKDEDQVVGLIEVFQRPTAGPASQRGYLKFLNEMCQHVGDYIRSRRLRELTGLQSLHTEVDRFSLAVHEGLDPATTAYTIANEGRRLIECDRVSVALRKGRKCVVSAVSGQDTMDTRSNAVVLLGKLATAVTRSGESLWYTGSSEDLPPQIESALHDYVDDTHSKTVAVLPLRRPDEEVPDGDESKKKRKNKYHEDVIGALIVEQIEDSRAPEEFAQTVAMVTQHSSRALSNAVEHNTLFLMPLWRAIGKAKWIIEARTLPKTLAVLAAVVLIGLFLGFFPWDFDMEAAGTLEPVATRNVFVEIDGTVVDVKVEQGETVEAGQVLFSMVNPTLDTRREELQGRLQTALEEIKSARAMSTDDDASPIQKQQFRADALAKRATAESLKKQLDNIDRQIGMLNVRSPVAGTVISWANRDRLSNRPMVRGDVGMTIADLGQEWEIIAFMEEDRMGHVLRALPKDGSNLDVKYILKSDPDNKLKGTLSPSGIHDAAELNDVHGHSVRVRININEDDVPEPRPGAEVTIKVHCGRKPIGYCFFHELVEFVESTLLF